MVKKRDLKKLLNLDILKYTNRTYLVGKYDLPYVNCPDFGDIDYLALYTERENYQKTNKTAVCFYQYDRKFDNIMGIFNAIYYCDKHLLAKYKERFRGVKFAISPDYSQCGDVPKIENLYRLFKSRIVSLWLLLECDVLVIPNITYASEDCFFTMLDGMEECNVVAFSTKGSTRNVNQKTLFLKALKYTVDGLKKLKKIIVYSANSDDSKTLQLFEYALSHNIKVIVPNNLLKERNITNRKEALSYGKI